MTETSCDKRGHIMSPVSPRCVVCGVFSSQMMLVTREVHESLTARLAAANADIDRLNQMLRATGYGQGQIDAYDDECEARERAEERLAAAEAAARWWRMAARGYILEEGEVHPDERWPWLADEAADEAAKGGRDE